MMCWWMELMDDEDEREDDDGGKVVRGLVLQLVPCRQWSNLLTRTENGRNDHVGTVDAYTANEGHVQCRTRDAGNQSQRRGR
jgi:hypothetical protein